MIHHSLFYIGIWSLLELLNIYLLIYKISKKKILCYCKLCGLNTVYPQKNKNITSIAYQTYKYLTKGHFCKIPPPNRILILKVQLKSVVSNLFTQYTECGISRTDLFRTLYIVNNSIPIYMFAHPSAECIFSHLAYY